MLANITIILRNLNKQWFYIDWKIYTHFVLFISFITINVSRITIPAEFPSKHASSKSVGFLIGFQMSNEFCRVCTYLIHTHHKPIAVIRQPVLPNPLSMLNRIFIPLANTTQLH